MKLLKILCVWFLAGLVPLAVLAAEANSGADADAGTEQVDQEPGTGAGSDQAAEDQARQDSEEESPSRFIPTEQISQDLGVSFPADI